MSETTIEIPFEHVAAVRQSLVGHRDDADAPPQLEELIGRLAVDVADDPRPRTLTGPYELLWSVVYDALCEAAERLADDCNEYWREGVDPEGARARVAAVGARLELLVALEALPGDR